MAESPLQSTRSTGISSTPIPSDTAIFSDEPFLASSPPSSPPEFPWEKSSSRTYDTPSNPQTPLPSAFSVLGKRKVFASIPDNARSSKKPTPGGTSARKDEKPLTQMQISIGQEVQKKCKACGMEYIASSEEDRKLHDKYHKQNVEGYDVGKEFLGKAREGTVFKTSSTDADIVAVDAFDSVWRRKRARAALDVVQRELGAVDIPDEQLWKTQSERGATTSSTGQYTAYMYVRQGKCIGLLLVQHISEAKKVVQPEKSTRAEDTSTGRKMSALERLRAKRAAQVEELASTQPIQLATKPSAARLGISRIWISPSHRGQGIAKSLLDQALEHHNSSPGDGQPQATKEDVAFSQPTEAGAKLARRWTGKAYGWKVYID